ncbi:uncharacterized protein BCR38DRAFT_526512 [Pseudomassariella vexata]|uniref:Uncharacterized protein n=1 Tax=Pseudomassariella vexata TaxID=1141098 RepID=A0A1Y2DP15_9PEZI|nr:uncharacterized protein BCR38DRAFT_526512 [Pseudomassariella vexata]ORY61022.1 hypothetical protein BCR38DRAFT_526512 [Pseudomassariella vexata]
MAPTPKQQMVPHRALIFDLNDLTAVIPGASAFLSQESRLDLLWNNARIGRSPFSLAVFVKGRYLHRRLVSVAGRLSLAEPQPRNYSALKANNWILASGFAKRTRKDDVIYVAQNLAF